MNSSVNRPSLRAVEELSTMPVAQLLRKNFAPAFAGLVISALYNIVDRIYIGHGVGVGALAGLSAVFPIMLIHHAFCMLLGIGSIVRISIALGAGQIRQAQRVLGTSLLASVALGGIFAVGVFFAKGLILDLFRVSGETVGYASDYLDVILLGSIFQLVAFTLSHIMRAEGNPYGSMKTLLGAALINIVLDPLFIFVFKWGVQGAAWATIIAQGIQMLWTLWYFLGKRCVVRLERRFLKINPVILVRIFAVGFAPFAMQLVGSLVQGIYTMQLARYGSDIAVSVVAIINSIAMLLILSIISINQASQPIYGYSYGAHQYERLLRTLRLTIRAALIIAVVGFSVVELLPAPLLRLFNSSDPRIVEIGVPAMRIFCACFPLVAFQVVAGNYFQSIGKAGIAAFLSLSRQLIFLIPLIYLMPMRYGLSGVWVATPISDFIACCVCLFFLVRAYRQLTLQARGAMEQESGEVAPA